MRGPVVENETLISRRQWLWEHAGRLAGVVLGIFAIAFLSLLAVAGYTPAALFIPVVGAFLVLIIVGGRVHGN
jgi:hypothetical protein